MSSPTAQASPSAGVVALGRAIESSRPEPRLFHDPIAQHFLSTTEQAAVRLAHTRPGSWVLGLFERGAPGLLGSLITRTRFIDDAVIAALEDGAEQVVILGAGYDARPYRIPELANLPVFEIDRRATQERKLEKLWSRLGPLPRNVRYVAVDFDTDDLGPRLLQAGFEPGRRCVFVWEGVTEYLDASAVDAVLRDFARLCAAHSELIFTYTDLRLLDESQSFPGGQRLLRANRRLNEPYRFGLHPRNLAKYLNERKLNLLEDVSGADLAQRYVAPLGRQQSVCAYERIARTRILAEKEDRS